MSGVFARVRRDSGANDEVKGCMVKVNSIVGGNAHCVVMTGAAKGSTYIIHAADLKLRKVRP